MAWEKGYRSGRGRLLRDATAAATWGDGGAQRGGGRGKGRWHARVDMFARDRKLQFRAEERESPEGKRAKWQRQWTSGQIFAELQCIKATAATLAAHSLQVYTNKVWSSFSLWECLWRIWAHNVIGSSISSNRGVNNLSVFAARRDWWLWRRWEKGSTWTSSALQWDARLHKSAQDTSLMNHPKTCSWICFLKLLSSGAGKSSVSPQDQHAYYCYTILLRLILDDVGILNQMRICKRKQKYLRLCWRRSVCVRV